MEKNEFLEFMKEECKKNNIQISNEEIEKLYIYMKEILEWNEKVNVTAIKDEKEFIVKHFIDSILIEREVVGDKLIDIGSGAGFPGIPLKIVRDDLKVTLIDSVNKKVLFMQDSIEKLKLDNIVAIHCRAEEYAHNNQYRESFDVATSRAVANMCTLVEYMLPFVKVGGKCICMKGPNSEEEINDSKKAISLLGGEIERVEKYKIDDNDRCLVLIKKVKKTEQIYPRDQGKPLKSPLK